MAHRSSRKGSRVKSSINIGKRIFDGINEGRYTEETVQHMVETLLQSRDRRIENLLGKLRERHFEFTKRNIAGALKNTIDAHGPITPNYIESAAKRIYTQCIKLKRDPIQNS